MDKTHLDEIIEYPNKVIQIISQNKNCVALILNKNIESITEDDFDTVVDNNIFDYEYVDNTTTEATSYIWVETDVPDVDNEQIKTLRLYVTIACHKNFMKLNNVIIPSVAGNRRDNLVRFIDKELNGSDLFGIGKLKLNYVKTLSSSNSSFTIREISYEIPDFNFKDNIWN